MVDSNLLATIKNDWLANGRDWTKPGFRALAVYRYGVWCARIERRLLRGPLMLIYRFLFRRIRNGYGIELPHSVKVGHGVVIEHQSAIVIHGNSIIGDACIIRQGVTLGNRYMDRPYEAPILGDRVNIGAGAKLLGGIKIGADATIGANAVVLKDVTAGDTVVGIPAKSIRRSD